MKNKKIVLGSLEDTEKLAKNLAAYLKEKKPEPIVFNLNGDLGSGKTTFTRFFVEALTGYQDVHSPTFTLMNIYPENIYNYFPQYLELGYVQNSQDTTYNDLQPIQLGFKQFPQIAIELCVFTNEG